MHTKSIAQNPYEIKLIKSHAIHLLYQFKVTVLFTAIRKNLILIRNTHVFFVTGTYVACLFVVETKESIVEDINYLRSDRFHGDIQSTMASKDASSVFVHLHNFRLQLIVLILQQFVSSI
jgi:hypothetical protein